MREEQPVSMLNSSAAAATLTRLPWKPCALIVNAAPQVTRVLYQTTLADVMTLVRSTSHEFGKPARPHASPHHKRVRFSRCWEALCVLALFICVCVCQLVSAQAVKPRVDHDNIEDTLPLTDDPSDPIGIDREPVAPPDAAPSGKVQAIDRGKFGPEPPVFGAHVGEVLTAVPSLRERAHRERVELAGGLAAVSAELDFENSAEKPAELVYRLAVPSDAALASLEVCNSHGCRPGVPDARGPFYNAYDDTVQARDPHGGSALLPAADARRISDERGTALLIRAAPVSRSQWLQVKLGYLTNAVVHGGVARLRLPARGTDPRAAPLELSASAKDLSELQANGLPLPESGLHADAWASVELSGRAAISGIRSELWKLPCGRSSCARAYAVAAPERAAPADIVLALDASPSTEGGARSRMLVAIAALLARAPDGSRVRALRFASRAVPLVSERKDPRDLALSSFASVAFEAELGAATRFEAAWSAIESLGFRATNLRKLVVIIGDGGLTTGPARPFEAAKRAGVEVAVINLADRATDPALARGAALSGGAVIDAGSEAAAAVRGAAPDALEERLAAVFQPARAVVHVSGAVTALAPLPLRGGESLLIEAKSNAGLNLQLGGRNLSAQKPSRDFAGGAPAHAAQATARSEDGPPPGLVAVDKIDLGRDGDRPLGQAARINPAGKPAAHSCDRRGPPRRQGGLSSDALPISLAEERAVCAVPKPATKPAATEPEAGTSMPGSPLLSMLRQRILPAARGCFRRDRAGRADYQVRAVFEFQLADREVVSARVEGKIAEDLRNCLLTAIDSLAVPRFSGRVVVRYPLVTEREPTSAQVELTAAAASDVDAVIAKP
jgi:hypothetical protein